MFKIVNMFVLPKLIYKFNAMPMKIQIGFFVGRENTDTKTKEALTFLKNRQEDLVSAKTVCRKALVNKGMWVLCRERKTNGTKEHSRALTDSYTYGNSMYYRADLTNQLENNGLFNQWH